MSKYNRSNAESSGHNTNKNGDYSLITSMMRCHFDRDAIPRIDGDNGLLQLREITPMDSILVKCEIMIIFGRCSDGPKK